MRGLAIGLVAIVGCQGRVEGPEVVGPEVVGPEVLRPQVGPEVVRGGPAAEGSRSVLVELYSSQGCNSCPAADAVLGRLPALGFAADEVVALTFHVTYWDYLGWRDPFGAARYDARQREYVDVELPGHDGRAAQGPYTPQMIVDGRVHFPGSYEQAMVQRIAEAQARPRWLTLTACTRRTADVVEVAVETRVSAPRPASEQVGVFAALAEREVDTAVPRGENAGRRLTEYGVVRALAGPVGRDESLQLRLVAPAGLNEAGSEVVVFAQDLGSRAIVAVTRAAGCAG